MNTNAHISWHKLAIMMVLATLWGATGCETNKDVEKDQDIDLDAPLETMTMTPSSAEVALKTMIYRWNATENRWEFEREIEHRDTVKFTVTGGKPPYWWRINDTDIGTLTTYGHRALYTPKEEGGNILIATDSRGNSASATILSRIIIERRN